VWTRVEGYRRQAPHL